MGIRKTFCSRNYGLTSDLWNLHIQRDGQLGQHNFHQFAHFSLAHCNFCHGLRHHTFHGQGFSIGTYPIERLAEKSYNQCSTSQRDFCLSVHTASPVTRVRHTHLCTGQRFWIVNHSHFRAVDRRLPMVSQDSKLYQIHS